MGISAVRACRTVIAEVGYLLAREAGARVESLFLQSLAKGDFTPVDLTSGATAHSKRPGSQIRAQNEAVMFQVVGLCRKVSVSSAPPQTNTDQPGLR